MTQHSIDTSQQLIQAIGQKAAMIAERAFRQAHTQIDQLDFAYLVQARIRGLGFGAHLYFDQEPCIGVPASAEQINHIKGHLKACGFSVSHSMSKPSHNGIDYVYTIGEAPYEQHHRPKQATVVFQED